MREAGYEDLHKNIQEFRSLHPANHLKDSIARAINQEYTPKPDTPASQAPAEPLLTVENKAPQGEPQQTKALAEGNPSEHTSADAANVAPMEKPSASSPKAPAAEPAKDHVAPAA